jgi:uncharacterized protein (TIGR03067 family)
MQGIVTTTGSASNQEIRHATGTARRGKRRPLRVYCRYALSEGFDVKTLPAVVGLLAVAAVTAAPLPKELKKKDDKERIVGTWVLKRANVNGTEEPNYFWHSMTFDDKGGLRFKYKDGPDQTATYELDATARPKRMTSRFGDGKGHTQVAPYEFRDGRLVMAIPNGGRKELASVEPGPGVIVLEYERVEPK